MWTPTTPAGGAVPWTKLLRQGDLPGASVLLSPGSRRRRGGGRAHLAEKTAQERPTWGGLTRRVTQLQVYRRTCGSGGRAASGYGDGPEGLSHRQSMGASRETAVTPLPPAGVSPLARSSRGLLRRPRRGAGRAWSRRAGAGRADVHACQLLEGPGHRAGSLGRRAGAPGGDPWTPLRRGWETHGRAPGRPELLQEIRLRRRRPVAPRHDLVLPNGSTCLRIGGRAQSRAASPPSEWTGTQCTSRG